MNNNKKPDCAGARKSGDVQSAQHANDNLTTSLVQTTAGRLPPDPSPNSGRVACFVCGSNQTKYVGYYEPPEVPGVTTKYGLCEACATMEMPEDKAAGVSRSIVELAAVTAYQFLKRNPRPGSAK